MTPSVVSHKWLVFRREGFSCPASRERRVPQWRDEERATTWGAKITAALLAATFACLPSAVSLRAADIAEVRPLLKQYCIDCHSTAKQKGDLDLEQFLTGAEARKQPKVWESVVEQIELGEMPPKDKSQPSSAEKERLLQWTRRLIEELALENAGDPGPVVLRRLPNAEYTWTLRDLTGLASLDPAREFPVDGAAGEGFVNTGQSLVMSPALLGKYLDAAKSVTAHAALTPDGIRFFQGTTRRDQTEELLGQIRAIYRRYTDSRGADRVNLQGIVFDTNEGGRLPIDAYLRSLITSRSGSTPTNASLSPRYLQHLDSALAGRSPSFLLSPLRTVWAKATAADVEPITASIAAWQKALWKFSPVGHIGKAGGPKAWMEPVEPLAARQELRLKLPEKPASDTVTVHLWAGDAGDGGTGDAVRWIQPRLVAPGRPDLLLRDVRSTVASVVARRTQLFNTLDRALSVADALDRGIESDAHKAAGTAGLADDDLRPWLTYLGVGAAGPLQLSGHLTNRLSQIGGYEFVRGFGSPETPSISANPTDKALRIPGNLAAHSVVVHPSPTLNIAAGWLAPTSGLFRVEGRVRHAHPECGNGVVWNLELRRGNTRHRLASGIAQGGKEGVFGPLTNLVVRPGDLVSVVVGPRDGNHSCDLTRVDLTLTHTTDSSLRWDLASDVSPDIHAGNPHADRRGQSNIWHFYTEPVGPAGDLAAPIPPGSVLARWLAAGANERPALASEARRLFLDGPSASTAEPDRVLHRQLSSLGGPLLGGSPTPASSAPNPPDKRWGLDPKRFENLPTGNGPDLIVQAPGLVTIELPAELVAGREFVVTAAPAESSGQDVTVQALASLEPIQTSGATASAPVLAREGSTAWRRVAAGFDEFRELFPAALCYSKIVPVDEVVTLTLYHREDAALARLMLDDAERLELERLWSHLHFVSQDALTLVDAFEQLWQYATQDADPKVFEPLREPIRKRAAEFRALQSAAEPRHLEAVLDFARRASRRPLASAETDQLLSLYRRLRSEEIGHEDAVRLVMARVLVSPAFLYRAEEPQAGIVSTPVNRWEIASRLSYFLWSSLPDAALLQDAAEGRLDSAEGIAAAARRMLSNERVRRLATEFGTAWLHVRDFDTLDEKSERHFPEFAALRAPLHEEVIRYFEDFFRNNRPVTDLLDGDSALLNETVAKLYGIPGVSGPEWRRVVGVKAHGRGGVLGLGAVLAKQAGASRTSPILRGNWLCEVLLGEKLPKPPKDVPRLPEDEAATEGLTVRQLVEKHSTDPRCSGCHVRIDPYGYAMEGFDAIGRRRDRDLAGRLIDTRVTLPGGVEVEGMNGLRTYLTERRRDAFVRQFCRKLTGYALGRGVQISDGPLLREMETALKKDGYRVGAALDVLVRSQPFRHIRGREFAENP